MLEMDLSNFDSVVGMLGTGNETDTSGSFSNTSTTTLTSSVEVTSTASSDGSEVNIDGEGNFLGAGEANFEDQIVADSQTGDTAAGTDTDMDAFLGFGMPPTVSDGGSTESFSNTETTTATSGVEVSASAGADGIDISILGTGNFVAAGGGSFNGQTSFETADGESDDDSESFFFLF